MIYAAKKIFVFSFRKAGNYANCFVLKSTREMRADFESAVLTTRQSSRAGELKVVSCPKKIQAPQKVVRLAQLCKHFTKAVLVLKFRCAQYGPVDFRIYFWLASIYLIHSLDRDFLIAALKFGNDHNQLSILWLFWLHSTPTSLGMQN